MPTPALPKSSNSSANRHHRSGRGKTSITGRAANQAPGALESPLVVRMFAFPGIVGQTPAMARVLDVLERR